MHHMWKTSMLNLIYSDVVYRTETYMIKFSLPIKMKTMQNGQCIMVFHIQMLVAYTAMASIIHRCRFFFTKHCQAKICRKYVFVLSVKSYTFSVSKVKKNSGNNTFYSSKILIFCISLFSFFLAT